MTRIVVDPDELDRFAGLAIQAADDYGARATSLRSLEPVAMPPDVASVIAEGIARAATNVDALAAGLYAEAMMLRTRAAVLDPVLRRYLVTGPAGRPA